jgi:hypothetical protein
MRSVSGVVRAMFVSVRFLVTAPQLIAR